MLAQGSPDPQCGGGGPLHLGEIARGHTGGPRLGGDGAQRLGGSVLGQQVEEAAQVGRGGGGDADMGGHRSSGIRGVPGECQ